MFDRVCIKASLLLALALPIAGCTKNQGLDSISISPATPQTIAAGTSVQYSVAGTFGSAKSSSSGSVGSGVTWTSSNTGVATITSGGLATGVAAGTATITASAAGWNGTVTSSTSLTVTATSSTTGAGEPLVSITILPNSISTANLEGTGQFLAYGTFSTTPTLMDITNGFSHVGFPASCTALPCPMVPVNWISAMPDVFPVNSSGAAGATAGLVTAEGSGNAVIYVTAANPDGTLVYSPSVTFNCPLVLPTYTTTNGVTTLTNAGSCNELTIASGLLVTLTVYNAGLNQTGWLVTAPSATGTPDVIDCGPASTTGVSVCMATYPISAQGPDFVPTEVTLTAPAEPGVNFGGWSSTCDAIDPDPSSEAGPNSCTIYLGNYDDPITGLPVSNVAVGAIFN